MPMEIIVHKIYEPGIVPHWAREKPPRVIELISPISVWVCFGPSETKVFQDRWSVKGERNDVVDLKRRRAQLLRQQAIFASFARATNDGSTQPCRHVTRRRHRFADGRRRPRRALRPSVFSAPRSRTMASAFASVSDSNSSTSALSSTSSSEVNVPELPLSKSSESLLVLRRGIRVAERAGSVDDSNRVISRCNRVRSAGDSCSTAPRICSSVRSTVAMKRP